MKNISLKWYKLLNFPNELDSRFEDVLNKTDFSNITTIEEFDTNAFTPEQILVFYLYFCEQLSIKYQSAGIDQSILMDTLSDLVIWSKVYYSLTGQLGIGEKEWLKAHLSFRLFKLGRLQFCMGKFEKDYPKLDIKPNDKTLEIHIAETGEKLAESDCRASIEQAKRFFAKHFANFGYQYFSCHSWLLDDTLKDLLPPQSNIIKFGTIFEKIDNNESDAILKYVFKWNTRRENLGEFPAKSSLGEKIKERVRQGGKFFEVLGVLKK